MLIRVKNTVESVEKNEVYGEELVAEWDWMRRIRDGIRKIDPNDTHPLGTLQICSYGKNLI